jgi:hypothetical protein
MDLLEDEPTVIHDDNQAAIFMTKNVMINANTRHIKLDYHYIRELVWSTMVKSLFDIVQLQAWLQIF